MNSGFVISLRWFCLNLDKVTQARVNDFMQIRCDLSKDIERTIFNNRKTGKGRLLSNISEVITEYKYAKPKVLNRIEYLKGLDLDSLELEVELCIEILQECENCISELMMLLIEYYPKTAVKKKEGILELYNIGFRSFGRFINRIESIETKGIAEQEAIGMKPVFKSEYAPQIFEILKDFFGKEQQAELDLLLKTGNGNSEHLIFRDSGNRLADAFKQLIEADLITQCNKKGLENWISHNFKYTQNDRIKEYKPRYLNDIISSKCDKCKKPLLNVKPNRSTGEIIITKVY
jgi:hypothetical protein